MPGKGVVDSSDIAKLRRSLNAIDKNLTKEFRKEFLVIGQEIASDARAAVPSKSGRAAGSIRAGMSGNNPYVAGGKKSVRYYGWLDFGSRKPKSGRKRSVGPWAGTGKGPKRGRFIYASVYRNRKKINAAAHAVMEKTRKASF